MWHRWGLCSCCLLFICLFFPQYNFPLNICLFIFPSIFVYLSFPQYCLKVKGKQQQPNVPFVWRGDCLRLIVSLNRTLRPKPSFTSTTAISLSTFCPFLSGQKYKIPSLQFCPLLASTGAFYTIMDYSVQTMQLFALFNLLFSCSVTTLSLDSYWSITF